MSVVTREGNAATIIPGRDIVSSMVPEFKQELNALVAGDVTELCLDLSGVAMMDSVGIGMIIAAHNSMKKKGGRLVVRNLSENIMKLFRSMRLDQHLTVAG